VLIDLVRLKLDALQLPSPVERLMLVAWVVPATARQVRMWQLAGRRDLDAATLALARLRAAFGPLAVVHAQLRQSHLPEAQFAWQALERMLPPHPSPPPEHRTLVRRLYAKPQPLPSRPKHEPDGWLLSDWRQGSVVKLWGPFRLTGGWWVREVRRDYYYVETERGDLLWVFFDAVRRRWFLQGVVD
jgi:protein ImuB